MARSSNLSEGMRDLAEEGAEQARRMADFGVFGIRDFAEHSVGQARQAFDGFLSATQRTMATFDQQASDIRQKTLSLAAGTIANSFEFTQRLLQARSAEELVQLQAEFAEAQMHAWADQTREHVAGAAGLDARLDDVADLGDASRFTGVNQIDFQTGEGRIGDSLL